MANDSKNTRVVEGPDGQPVTLVRYYPSPIWVPEEVKEALDDEARQRGLKLVDLQLIATMRAAGYDDTSIAAARTLLENAKDLTEPATEADNTKEN